MVLISHESAMGVGVTGLSMF